LSADAVSRAYVTLGLKRGCNARDVKQQYKALVRKWHPDRYASDPVGLAEATAQLRRINDAFKTLEASVRPATSEPYRSTPTVSRPPDVPEASDREPKTYSGRPLTAAEIEHFARAIGRPDPIGMAFDFATWFVPMLLGFLFLYVQRTGRGPAIAWALIVFAIVTLLRQSLRRSRRRTS
jgi:hypothetical protein